MHVNIVLESPHQTWTSLDRIRGKIVLNLDTTTPITSVVVKLEGDSRTRLIGQLVSRGAPPGQAQRYDEDRKEFHKVLYKIDQVFPRVQPGQVADSPFYTLGAGLYEYPFEFKIPVNSICYATNPAPEIGFRKGLKLEVKPPTQHIKTTLPPTLTSFPGMAEIKYYLKVTVNRKEFYKQNPRLLRYFNFLPVEPPRKALTGAETYARRQHQFPPSVGQALSARKRSMFGLRKGSSSSVHTLSSSMSEPPIISVDSRLPEPAILTCNRPVPLRLLVKRLNASTEPLFLHSFHMQLVAKTRIRAQGLHRECVNDWVIQTKANMGLMLASIANRDAPSKSINDEGDEVEEFTIDENLWLHSVLPNDVSPTFETCNISRAYVLELQVGIGFGNPSENNTVILPLSHPVQIYSGIAPSPALLAAVNSTVPARKPVQGQTPTSASPITPTRPITNSVVLTPTAAGPSSQPQYSAPTFAPLHPDIGVEDPPPSYEDAIAADLPPLDGPRARYEPPRQQELSDKDDRRLWGDNRRDSR